MLTTENDGNVPSLELINSIRDCIYLKYQHRQAAHATETDTQNKWHNYTIVPSTGQYCLQKLEEKTKPPTPYVYVTL